MRWLILCLFALPAAAQELPREVILDAASRQGLCGVQTPVDAWYENGQHKVRCGDPTGFVPAIGALGLGAGTVAAGIGLAVLAATGGGGATPSTE